VTVCVDASLIVRCLSYEPGTGAATGWLQCHGDEEMVAPWLLAAEVASVLRLKAGKNEMTVAESKEAMRLLGLLDIRFVFDLELVRRAYEVAEDLNQPSIYDALYVAVAEREKCDLWTADTRFANAASPRYPFVRIAGA